MKSGTLVIISAPSGGGKNTVIEKMLPLMPNSARFVTTTTRLPRAAERSGVDYHFLTRSEFVYKIVNGDFAEHVTYAGNYYGVDQNLLFEMLKKHTWVFAPIDVKGKESLQKLVIPQVSIFLQPESLKTLETRINRRPGATPEDTARRLAVAQGEIAKASTYDYQIVNYEGLLGATVDQVKSILDKI